MYILSLKIFEKSKDRVTLLGYMAELKLPYRLILREILTVTA